MARESVADQPLSALTGLETGVTLVNNVNTALATHDNTVFVACFCRLKGIPDFHVFKILKRFRPNRVKYLAPKPRKIRARPPAVNSNWTQFEVFW